MRVPSLQPSASLDDPLVVVRSGFWNFNAIGLYDGDEALVVDPGIYPEDIALLAAAVTTRRRSGAPRQVMHVILTHSHHDHIRGWQHFPGARITTPEPVAQKNALSQSRILASKQAIDDTLGIKDPAFTYPAGPPPGQADGYQTFAEETQLMVGRLEVQVRLLLGHSNCCSVVWIPAIRTLLTADYLVSPGIPYCRWQVREFEEALTWLSTFCAEQRVQRIVPAHNRTLEGQSDIHAALRLEIDYFKNLRGACKKALASGQDTDQAIKQAAEAMQTWRPHSSRAAQRQDRDNAARMVAEIG